MPIERRNGSRRTTQVVSNQRRLRSVELFTGAGGLALGIAKAGFENEGMIERDQYACDTVRENQRRGHRLVLDWKPLDAIIADNGDFGFSWGTYVSSIDNDGNREEAARGKYVSIWTKTDNGWRFVADIGNQEPPAQ